MSRKLFGFAIVMTLSLVVSVAQGEPRRGGGGRSDEERSSGERSRSQQRTGRKPPGGSWSEYNHLGSQGKEQSSNEGNKSGEQAAAAGAARSNRNSPKASGAEGAAAGVAASNRNNSKYTGAQGAAAGAAASNRNNPQYSGAQGAAAGAAVANRHQPQYSGAQGAAMAAGYAGVRNNVDHPGMYSPQWYGEHQSAWSPGDWRGAGAWAQPTWRAVSDQFNYDIDVTPVPYNYGSNVTCVNNNVVVNGQSVGTAEEFSQQADEMAEKGTAATPSPNDKWLPLGVFALVRNEQQHPQLILQLAVNQQGILRGNYTDEVIDSTLPVHGAIDPKTQRAAWTVGNNRYSVMEAGLTNLTQGEVPALIHKNGTTQKWLLVRLSQASQRELDAASGGGSK